MAAKIAPVVEASVLTSRLLARTAAKERRVLDRELSLTTLSRIEAQVRERVVSSSAEKRRNTKRATPNNGVYESRWTNRFVDDQVEGEWALCCSADWTRRVAMVVGFLVVGFAFIDTFEVGSRPDWGGGRLIDWAYLSYFPVVAPIALSDRCHRLTFTAALCSLVFGSVLKLAQRGSRVQRSVLHCEIDDGLVKSLPAEAFQAVGSLLVIVSNGATVAVHGEFGHVVAITVAGMSAGVFGQVLAAIDLAAGRVMEPPPFYVTLASCAAIVASVVACKTINAQERRLWASLRDAVADAARAEARLVVAHRDAEEGERRAVALLRHALSAANTGDNDRHIESIPINQLDLRHVLGVGAFGEVILASWRGIDVVLKRIKRSAITPDRMALLADELRMMVPLRHPNVVSLYGCVDDDCNVGMVLEFAAKGDLLAVLLEAPPSWSWRDPLRRMALDVARGLAYLHDRGLIHRDLKSKNVLVTNTFALKICDFNLSLDKEADDADKRCVGTPLYMAPETIRGQRATAKADVYALGVVLVEMANRAPPYSTAKDDQSLAVFAILDAVDKAQLRPAVVGPMPPDVAAVKDACFQDDPDARPTVRDILAGLSRDDVGGDSPGDAAAVDDATSSGGAPPPPRNQVAFVADTGSLWFQDDVDIVDEF